MRERKRGIGPGKGSAGGHCETSGIARQVPPDVRRWIARDGDRAAVERRSEIDLTSGLGKPRGVLCGYGDHVATFAATPTTGRHAGTRFLVTDAAPGWGSHPTCVGSRRRLPHSAPVGVTTAERFHATG